MKIIIPVTVWVFVRNHHDKMTIFAQRYRKEVGKQEPYLKQRLEELEKLVENARIQSTKASIVMEDIVTTST